MKINQKTVVAACIVISLLAVVALAGPALHLPDEAVQDSLAALGAIGALALGYMRSFIEDSDHDGVPDILEEERELDDVQSER